MKTEKEKKTLAFLYELSAQFEMIVNVYSGLRFLFPAKTKKKIDLYVKAIQDQISLIIKVIEYE